jgi:hypothetical protein
MVLSVNRSTCKSNDSEEIQSGLYASVHGGVSFSVTVFQVGVYVSRLIYVYG